MGLILGKREILGDGGDIGEEREKACSPQLKESNFAETEKFSFG